MVLLLLLLFNLSCFQFKTGLFNFVSFTIVGYDSPLLSFIFFLLFLNIPVLQLINFLIFVLKENELKWLKLPIYFKDNLEFKFKILPIIG